MVTLGKKRNKPTLETRMRGLATQARKVELAEPVLRQRRNEKRTAKLRESAGAYSYGNTDRMTVNLEPTQPTQPTKGSRSASNTNRGENLIQESTASEFTKKVTRNELVTKKREMQDGLWDQILVFNQTEGHRIAAMARQENERRKEENRIALDAQVKMHEKKRQAEVQRQQAYIKEQRTRLRKLEAEEDRKEMLRLEQIRRVRVEQDEAVAMVLQRKQKEKERELRESEEMMQRMREEERKDRAKQKARADAEKARAYELKQDLIKQLAAKEEMKRFEAQEEKMLQRAARQKADAEEKQRLANLEELMEKMRSKQKLAESTAADVAALAKADEERALRHQAEYDAKLRKEMADKKRKQQLMQQDILKSLEEQLQIKTKAQEEELILRQKEAIELKKQSEIAFEKACAERDAEAAKKEEYYAQLTAQIEADKGTEKNYYGGMSATEQAFNSRIIGKMSGTGGYGYCP